MFLNPENVVQQLGLLPGMVVIDVGSGIGNFSRAIVQHIGTSGHVYALDILPDVVQRLRNDCRESGITNVTALVADIEHIDGVSLVHESADIILLSNVLFQCTDKPRPLGFKSLVISDNTRSLSVH
jgi:ubiquinone/menaquinone biosynthesis C-methylase UbiE